MSRRGSGRDRQRGRQRDYPGRDDVARIALHWLIVKTARLAVTTSNPERMHVVEDALLDGLVAQGFDARASEQVLDELIDKYVDGGWGFRRKLHLQKEPPVSSRVLMERDKVD